MNTNRTFGYARVSTRDQNLDRQVAALANAGVALENIVCDRTSGKDFNREGWRTLVQQVRAGDELVVGSIDRLGRDYKEIHVEWNRLVREYGVSIRVLDMPLLSTCPEKDMKGITWQFVVDLLLGLLAYTAQIERENIRSRQRAGIDQALERGVKFGRAPLERPACWPAVLQRFSEGELTRKQAAELLGVSTSTFDRWRKA